MDQFAEPKDPDGDVKRKYVNIGKVLIQELENILLMVNNNEYVALNENKGMNWINHILFVALYT